MTILSEMRNWKRSFFFTLKKYFLYKNVPILYSLKSVSVKCFCLCFGKGGFEVFKGVFVMCTWKCVFSKMYPF